MVNRAEALRFDADVGKGLDGEPGKQFGQGPAMGEIEFRAIDGQRNVSRTRSRWRACDRRYNLSPLPQFDHVFFVNQFSLLQNHDSIADGFHFLQNVRRKKYRFPRPFRREELGE